MTLSIFIADDEADVVMGNDNFPYWLSRAFEVFGFGCEQLEITSEYRKDMALQRINDLDLPLDLIFVDMKWPALNMDKQDGARDLLVAALKRADCVVVGLSQEGPILLHYLFDASKVKWRPHAALLKGHFADVELMAGTISTAFSNARMPLMSRNRSFKFDYDNEANLKAVQAIGKVILQEIVAMALPNTLLADVKVLAGGLSGAAVILVDAERDDGGHVVKRSAIIKLAQDRNSLESELDAHADTGTVPLFPANQFAGLLKNDIIGFGGWYALVFQAAPGKTAAAAGAQTLTSRRWNQVFTRDLLSAYSGNASIGSVPYGDWVVSDDGLLAGNRWKRLCRSATALGASQSNQRKLERGATTIFPNAMHQTAFSVVHGDFHTRNVLIADSDRVYWLDAASMRRPGIWCEDLARFGVWTACGLLDPADPIDENAEHLLAALLQSRPVAARTWQDSLSKRVRSTLSTAQGLWAGKGFEVDVGADWELVVTTELLRASYSVDMFGAEVRLAALNAAIAVKFEPR